MSRDYCRRDHKNAARRKERGRTVCPCTENGEVPKRVRLRRERLYSVFYSPQKINGQRDVRAFTTVDASLTVSPQRQPLNVV